MKLFRANPVVMLAVMLSCITVPVAVASTSFEQLLEEADRVRSSDPKRFRTLLKQLDERSGDPEAGQPQRDHLQYLNAYWKAAYGRQLDSGIADAELLFEQAEDPDLKYRAGSLAVNLYAINRSFGAGLRYLDQTLAMRHLVADKEIRHDGINGAGIFYNHLGQYTLGLQLAEEILDDAPGPRVACFAGFVQVQALFNLGKLAAGDELVRKAIDQCARLNENLTSNAIRLVLAQKWAARGQRDNAIALLEQFLAEAESTGYHRLIGEMHSLLGELYLAVGKTDKARSHAELAIEKNAAIANSFPLVTAYRVLYEIAHERGDPVAALSHYRKYAEADRAHINDVKAREMVYQIARQENAQKSQQIQLLNQQNQVLQLQQHVDRQARNNTRLVIALLVLLVGLISYWAYKVKRLHISLRRFAETDALTTVSNRHFFTQRATQSLAMCEKSGESIALIMFDLDHFKVINDSYGHVSGDWALKQVAEACRGFCREIDLLGRVGGEEFAILLHGCDLRGATRLAEDTRVRISQIDTRGSGFHFSITASFGVSSTALSGYCLDQLMAHADLMLYRAKNEGRNRVRVYATETPALPQPRLVPQHKVRSTAAPVQNPQEAEPRPEPLPQAEQAAIPAVERLTG